ncbi:hypothetical protein KAR91_81585 [Candidatus Pacearchaeota archaeon]|nr:hypothetical protein [Candidatus Pacearchaeota archaeon]
MKITLICPICRKERTFNRWWSLVFGEERATFKKREDKLIKSNWIKDLPRIWTEIEVLEKTRAEIEKKIDRKTRLELGAVCQKLTFLYERIKNNKGDNQC